MLKIINHVKTRYQAKELVTYTLPENQGALEFYKKLGFEPTGKVLPVGDLELRLKLKDF